MRRVTRTAAILAVPWLAAPPPITAQETSTPLAVGERVRARVAPGGRRYTGSLIALRSDTLVLQDRQRGAVSLPLLSVMQLERSRGPGWCRRRPGSRIGCVALGIVSGALIGGTIGFQTTKCDGCDLHGIGVILGAPVGAAVGLIVGAIAGGERWERVAVPATTSR
jgi:hypothetical protein